jgi:hypothetical protein
LDNFIGRIFICNISRNRQDYAFGSGSYILSCLIQNFLTPSDYNNLRTLIRHT